MCLSINYPSCPLVLPVVSHIEPFEWEIKNDWMTKLLATVSLACLIILFGIVNIVVPLKLHGANNSTQLPCPTPSPSELPISTEPLTLEEFSPYEIRDFVNSHRQGDLTFLWERLNLKTINVAEQQQLEPDNFNFLTNCNDCDAALFLCELDGEPGNEAIVRIQDQSMQASRFLIFKELDEPAGEWKLMGHIDEMLNKYRMAQHTVVVSGGKSWLIITGQGASGSGVALYVNRVFLVKPDGLRAIMAYVAEGSQAGYFGAPSREFFSSVQSCELSDDVATVKIRFSAKYFFHDYSNQFARVHLFTKTQSAVFSRRLDDDEARLDREVSELTERELSDVYYIDSLSDEEFLLYNYENLARVASGQDAPRKQWLTQFLSTCQKTSERERLEALLKL